MHLLKTLIKPIKSFINSTLPLPIKRLIFRIKRIVIAPFLFKVKRGKVAIAQKPIVLMSLPRSGSSWLGSIIGIAQNVRYLREPVTTAYMLKDKNRVSVLTPKKITSQNEYINYIQLALSGVSKYSITVTPFLTQWRDLHSPKLLVIKEVNPLAIPLYNNNGCKIIYLTRHPFAIAKSYQSLNWRSEHLFARKFSSEELDDIIQMRPDILSRDYSFQKGFIFGWIEAYSQQKLSNESITIRYEDICASPTNEIESLCKAVNIAYGETVEKKLSDSLSGTKHNIGQFDLSRDSSLIGQVLINKENQSEYNNVMSGYNDAYQAYNSLNNCQYSPFYSKQESFIKQG